MKRWAVVAAALAVLCGAHAQNVEMSENQCFGKDTVRLRNFHDLTGEIKHFDWGRAATTFAISSGLKLVVDHSLKHAVGEMRPDGSDKHSFPSRHSSWAYGLAGFVTYNLAPYSPWWGVGAHFAANCVGMQRVMARCHFPHDVMAGVGIAAATSAVSQLVGNWIFGYKNPFPCWKYSVNAISQSLTVTTGIAFPLQRSFGNCFLGNSLVSDIRYALPVSNVFMLAARGSMQSSLVKTAGEASQSSLNAVTLCIGAVAHTNPCGGPFAIDWRLDAGYRLMNAPKRLSVSAGSLTANAGLVCTLMLTRSFAMGLDASCGVYSLSMAGTKRAVAEPAVAFVSRASF